MSVCIIPARGGSRRIKGKNIRLFHGKPIIQYAIENAKAAGFKRVIVSTDSDEVILTAVKCGADIHFRKPEHAKDEVGTQEVGRIVCEEERIHSMTRVCLLYATTPLLTPDILKQACRLTGYTWVVGVGAEPLRDAGAFYIGKAESFKFSHPLYLHPTRPFVIPEERVCDINTETDWVRADDMYTLLNNEEKS